MSQRDRGDTAVPERLYLLYVLLLQQFFMRLLFFIHKHESNENKQFQDTCSSIRCHSLQCSLFYLPPFCFIPWSAFTSSVCAASLSASTLFCSSSFTLHIAISFPLPHHTLGLLFPLLCLCPLVRLSNTNLFCPSVVFYLSFRRLPPLSFGHTLFSSVLPCLMPEGLWLWMLHVLLCVSRAHSLLLLQLCEMMAQLTLRPAAVMVI